MYWPTGTDWGLASGANFGSFEEINSWWTNNWKWILQNPSWSMVNNLFLVIFVPMITDSYLEIHFQTLNLVHHDVRIKNNRMYRFTHSCRCSVFDWKNTWVMNRRSKRQWLMERSLSASTYTDIFRAEFVQFHSMLFQLSSLPSFQFTIEFVVQIEGVRTNLRD